MRNRDPIAEIDKRFVRAWMDAHDITMQDLAERIGAHGTLVPKYLSDSDTGSRPVPYPVAVRIADALGVQTHSVLLTGPICPTCRSEVSLDGSAPETADARGGQ